MGARSSAVAGVPVLQSMCGCASSGGRVDRIRMDYSHDVAGDCFLVHSRSCLRALAVKSWQGGGSIGRVVKGGKPGVVVLMMLLIALCAACVEYLASSFRVGKTVEVENSRLFDNVPQVNM